MIIRFQRDSHNLTCHKKSRLLFALNLVRQAVTVHSSVCIIYDTTLRLYAEFVDCKYCTVTCRQFLNLTFAPRKTCNGFFHHSNLALLCYHVTQRFLLYTIPGINQVFFSKISIFLSTSAYNTFSPQEIRALPFVASTISFSTSCCCSAGTIS